MPAWIPLLKASLPYLTQIVSSAIPAFTTKPDATKVDPVVARQIEELQAAATKNAESVHVLAEKLQQTIQGIDLAGENLQREMQRLRSLCIAAMSLSAAALVVSLIALLT